MIQEQNFIGNLYETNGGSQIFFGKPCWLLYFIHFILHGYVHNIYNYTKFTCSTNPNLKKLVQIDYFRIQKAVL